MLSPPFPHGHPEAKLKDILKVNPARGFFATLRMTAAGVIVLGLSPAHADSPLAKLSDLKAKLQTEQQAQDALKDKMSSAQDQLEDARKKLIPLTHNLQDNEKTLSELEPRLAQLQEQEKVLSDKIHADYGSMGNLILALERIRRMPTETLVIRPGAPLETAESAILLQSILPAINKRTEAMGADLKQMQELQKALEEGRAKAIKTSSQLKSQQQDLQTLLSTREKLYNQTKSDYQTQAESVARVASEAQSVQQLVTRIQENEDKKDVPEMRRVALAVPKLPHGRWTLPVQGKVVTRFGQRDAFGAASEGLKISARSGAVVSAPVSGVIRFAGPFRNYGNMVIIEHDHEFHSLISGLSQVDVQVGRNISAGEPIGSLSGSGAASPPTLYYELRHNGKPVDPSSKFPDLS